MWGRFSFIFVAFSAIAEQIEPEVTSATTNPSDSKPSGNVSFRAFHSADRPIGWNTKIVPYVPSLRLGLEPEIFWQERNSTDPILIAYLYLDMQWHRFENCRIQQAPKKVRRKLYTNSRSAVKEKLSARSHWTLVDCMMKMRNIMSSPDTIRRMVLPNMKLTRAAFGILENCSNMLQKIVYSYGIKRMALAAQRRRNGAYKSLEDCTEILRETLRAPEIAKLSGRVRPVLSFLIASLKKGAKKEVGKSKKKSHGRRSIQFPVIDGSEAPDGKYPYIVSLRWLNHHYCGASIINKRWVLTTAHCVEDENKVDGSTVVVGTDYLDAGGDSYLVEKVLRHPNYEKFIMRNDIGLIRVKSDIVFGSKVQPVVLPTGECTQSYSNQAVVSGWGSASHHGGYGSNKLQHVELNVIPWEECKSRGVTYADVICAMSKTGEGVCEGDSGGPLVAGGVQIGVVSTTFGLCAVGELNLFSSICAFIPWINENTKE